MRIRALPVLIMGFSSSLLQILCLRQLLTVFSGNELDIGITFAVWLTAVGAGSYVGHRFRHRHALSFSFMAAAFLSQMTVLFISLIRPALSLESGETVTLAAIIISTIITLFPLCFLVGVQFPLAVAYTGKPSKAYSLEAAGAFMGGVSFTFLLSGRVDMYMLSAAVSVLNIATAIFLIKRRSLAFLFILPVAFYFGINQLNERLLWKEFRLADRVESRYGEIKVLKIRGQSNVYASGKFQFSYPDPQTEELHSHLPMSLHPYPGQILIVGGSPALLREFLKYPVSHIDFVEIDPKMIEVSFRLLSPSDREIIKDKKITIIAEDARKFIKKRRNAAYDFILLNLPEPSTANVNRFYTVDFFREVKSILRKDGILVFAMPTSSGYIGRKMQVANGSIYNSAGNVFRHLGITSEEYGYVFASDNPVLTDIRNIKDRFLARQIETQYFHTYIIEDAFSPLKTEMVRERFRKISSINRDIRPVSYLYSLMLWAEMHGGKILNYALSLSELQMALSWAVLLCVIAVFALIKKKTVYFSLFTTGYSAMAFSMIIILTYQALFGYVYEMIGLLTAFFMIGMAIGASAAKGGERPLRWLQSFEIIFVLLFVFSSFLFKYEVSFYLLNFLCGLLAGMQFAAANEFIRSHETIRIAGSLYATDLIGSFAGALLTSIFLMPLLGVHNTIISLVSLKGLSFVLLLSLRDEKS